MAAFSTTDEEEDEKNDEEQPSSENEENAQEQVENTNRTEEQQQSWSTYENPELGISIEYPSDIVDEVKENEYREEADSIFPELEFDTPEGALLEIDIGKVVS